MTSANSCARIFEMRMITNLERKKKIQTEPGTQVAAKMKIEEKLRETKYPGLFWCECSYTE